MHLVEPHILSRTDGARSRDPLKTRKDAELLKLAIQQNPSNTRHWFYYAQSCLDAGMLREALAAYLQRATMGGWEEEVYVSLLIAARLSEQFGHPTEVVTRRFLEAHQARPHRVEALTDLARYHRERKEWALALLFSRAALGCHPDHDILYVEPAAHEWRAQDECAIASHWAGRYEDSRAIGRAPPKVE